MQRQLHDLGFRIIMATGDNERTARAVATRLGIDATIVMPTTAPFTKVSHTASHGATVMQEGNTLAESTVIVTTRSPEPCARCATSATRFSSSARASAR